MSGRNLWPIVIAWFYKCMEYLDYCLFNREILTGGPEDPGGPRGPIGPY